MFKTDIGLFTLTENQVLNTRYMGIAPFESFNYIEGRIYANSAVEPNQQQISDLITALNALPDTTPQQMAISMFQFKNFWGYVYNELTAEATYALCGFETPIESFFHYPNIAGIRPFLQGLVGQVLAPGDYTVLQSDVDIIVAGFAAQGVVLP